MPKFKLIPFLPLLFLISNGIIVNSAPIILTCGSDTGGTDSDGRKWDSDSDGKFLPQSSKTSPATAQFQDPSLPSTIPYMSARIITGGEFSYNFPITPKTRYFLRLHFYPASYTTPKKAALLISDSFFSATVNGITLLNNFSASITAEALTQAFIVREFSLSPSNSDDSLTLTLKPSDKRPKAFAFINGIELVAESPDLFTLPADLVGFSDPLELESANLQTVVRLNVGGSFISPTKDSGDMSRTWYDDTPYLAGANAGVTSPNGGANGTIEYRNSTMKVIAPEDVYRTWRSMGPDPKITSQYNLTWNIQVDPNFTYIVRMHFCDPWYDKINERVFLIYINNQSALQNGAADVVGWTGGKMIPTYKDFAIYVNNGNKDVDGDTILSLGLHPEENAQAEYLDAILNGLEIFKMSSARNLAGPNPTMSKAMAEAQEKSRGFGKSGDIYSNLKIIGAAGCATVFGIAAMVGLVICRRKKRYPRSKSTGTSWLPVSLNSQTASKSTMGGSSVASAQLSSEAAANCRHFSLTEIKKATKSFDESHVIGVGGFGKVYRGLIDGKMKVAIKRSNPSSEQGVHEFVTEIEMLSKLRHKHLVSLIGYCEEEGEMALVYDHMAHGTLREHLYKGNKINLTWKQRLEIAIGSAKGLHYLHTGAKYTIIHRDVKTTNILLDENWVSKVSDFGLSKTGPDVNQNHVSTMVKGSFGYLDPEYFRRQQLTEKSDVYSFGVVLFEILCARPALNPNLPKEQVSLADWSLHCVNKGTIEEMIDPNIKDTINQECLKKYIETAVKCLSDHGIDRPSMSDLLWNLEFALQLQESEGSAANKAAPTTAESAAKNAMSKHYSTLSLGEEDLCGMNLDGNDTSNAVFSQAVHPKGR